MDEHPKIPVVVGVTGHREIPAEDEAILREAARAQLEMIRGKSPHSPHILLSALAKGADQFCAEEALRAGYDLIAVLPLPVSDYEKDFDDDDRVRLHTLLDAAVSVLVAPENEPVREDRRYRYRQAGIYVADHCQIMLAFWDGAPGSTDGCGTADVVRIRQESTHRDPAGSPFRPEGEALIRIATRKIPGTNTEAALSGEEHRGSPDDADPPALTPGEVSFLGGEKIWQDVLEKTEEFNVEAEQSCSSADGSPGQEAASPGVDRTERRLQAVYEQADRESMKNAGRYRLILALLAVAATLVTIAFLLYDEAELHWMILVCGVMILCLFLANRTAKRLQCHRKYLEYRIFAESLRVQQYLHRAGASAEVPALLPWTIRMNIPWVRSALPAVMAGSEKGEKQSVRACWVEEQLQYHRKALQKTIREAAVNDRIVKISLILSIAFYLFALFFEIRFAGLLSGASVLGTEQAESVRTILKILLGSLSAAALFTGNYFGKLSLDQTADDHRRMIALFERAAACMDRLGETEELLTELAREELNENSSWFACQSVNTPGISL